MYFVLQDQLLKEHKSSFMSYSLSQLYNWVPSVGSKGLLTLITLLIPFCKSNDHRLLHNCIVEDLFWNGKFHLHTLRMRLCPDETRVYYFNTFGDPTDFLKQKCEHLVGLSVTIYPWGPTPPLTSPALVHIIRGRDPFWNINCPKIWWIWIFIKRRKTGWN